MKITIARIGGPADQHGATIGPAAIPAGVAVPLFEEFDYSAGPIGQAVVQPDGSADLELRPGIEIEIERLEADASIGIGYRVLEEHDEGGVRVIDRLELLAVGVSRNLIKRTAAAPDLGTCPKCGAPLTLSPLAGVAPICSDPPCRMRANKGDFEEGIADLVKGSKRGL